MSRTRKNGVASPVSWHSAMVADRIMRAEHLRLPSGATILAVKPEPLEWILSGRIPQNLLGAALEAGAETHRQSERAMTRQEIVDLAAFARQLVEASVVEPPIGDGPGEMPMDEIPVKDRAFIFEWACRALGQKEGVGSRESGVGQSRAGGTSPTPYSREPTPESDADRQEGHSIPQSGMERFREK